jgi:hypothetical protein
MDLHLQQVRTGETFKLSPERTLIGAADHATVRTAADGPYLAALAVRYPTGWALFGLSDDPEVTFNRRPFKAVQRVAPKKGDLLMIRGERFTFVAPGTEPAAEPPEPVPPPVCLAYIKNPDGLEECRVVDHDLLFGRLPYCHVQLADSKLSRLSALLASDDGLWYVHTLSKKVIGRNRKPVHNVAMLADGDELLIGPLVVRIELRGAGVAPPTDSTVNIRRPNLPPAAPARTTERAETTDEATEGPLAPDGPNLEALRASAQELEHWLKAQTPPVASPRSGLGGWLDSQRDRLRRFWFDTPETTSARSLRAAGKLQEAFAVLVRAIRARPESPELLRELYRLYVAVGFTDLCFRPLRQIEKLAEARGAPDTWVLETLARLCEKLGPTRPTMFDRAIGYWTKLEAATGVSYSRQRSAVLALRTIHQRGQTNSADEDSGRLG